MRVYLEATALLLAVSAAAVAQSFDRVRESIRQQLAEREAPSLAVAVARGGEILWEEGFGWADRENRIPATEHTVYSLASISKPVTATALMVLVERGLIDLDQPIDTWLGPARLTARVGRAEAATVRRVANHTAGLPLHYHFFYQDEPYQAPPMEETIRRYGILVTLPGERYHYSNIGYGILGHLIARVSGRPYADFLREAVFEPLGLARTSVDLPAALAPHAAVRYASDGRPLPFYGFDHPAASAVWASAHDLVRFGMFHLKARLPGQQPILSDKAIDAMQKSTAGRGAGSGYGLGWGIDRREGYTMVSHTGGMGGVRTVLRLIPARKIAVAVLTNASNELPVAVSDEILAVLLPGWKGAGSPPPAVRKFRPRNEYRGTWEGRLVTYQSELPVEMDVAVDGRMSLRIGTGPMAPVNGLRWEDGYLTGVTQGDLGTPDASRRPYALTFRLRPRGGVLNGPVTAVSRPGSRPGNALSSWLELKKR